MMVAAVMMPAATFACTSAIVSASANPSGRPILWKHRDTSTIDNKIEYIAPGKNSLGYVALFNAADENLSEAWMGMNEAGFAIMNTASYNIKDDNVPARNMDQEGIIMTKALRICRTVDDFRNLLDTLSKPLGVEANFGVIDALGNGAYFETNNYSYIRFDLEEAEGGVLVRTNYSHSGRKNEGYGHVREANANCLLAPYIQTGNVTPELLTENLSRTFFHTGHNRDFTLTEDKKVLDLDFIPRYKSTATIAIEGCRPVESLEMVTPDFVSNEYIMWSGVGYPPVAEIRAVRCIEDGVPDELRGNLPNGHCSLGDEAKRLRNLVFTSDKKSKYIDLSKLYNQDGTGFAQQAIKRNKAVYQTEKAKRDGKTN